MTGPYIEFLYTRVLKPKEKKICKRNIVMTKSKWVFSFIDYNDDDDGTIINTHCTTTFINIKLLCKHTHTHTHTNENFLNHIASKLITLLFFKNE